MVVLHLAVSCPDPDAVPAADRDTHHAQLEAWRAAGYLIGLGTAPDGRSAELVCRLARAEQLDRLWAEDHLAARGLWTGGTVRSFTVFVEPWELPPPDPARQAVVVEGPVLEADLAQFALIELRGTGRMAFGGLFAGGGTWALLRTADPVEAVGWLGETGMWAPAALAARPLGWLL